MTSQAESSSKSLPSTGETTNNSHKGLLGMFIVLISSLFVGALVDKKDDRKK